MDALPLLRTYRDDLPEPDDERMLAIRARLETRMTAEPTPALRPRLRPRLVIGGGVGVAAASVLVAALVTAGPAPQASAEAVRLLDAAADTARAAAPADGYRTRVVRTEGLSEQLGGDGTVVAAYNARSVVTTRVPSGRGEWTRTTAPLAPDAFYGGEAARRLAASEGALEVPDASPAVERSADGTFTNGELGGGAGFGSDPIALRDLPTDPVALLAALRAADLGVGSRGEAAHVLEAASTVLTSGAADARLQAAVFEALRLQPGLTVVDRTAELDGRTGVAIGEAKPSWRYEAHQLVIDPDTGRYLGDRDVALLPQGVIPAGAIIAATTVLRP